MPGEIEQWNGCYVTGQLPWDSRRVSTELQAVLRERDIPRGRALELGCGTGTNAIFLEQQGFEVTAVDFAPEAIAQAQKNAAAAGVEISFHATDVREFRTLQTKFAFIFDRGCYHCVRQTDWPGYLATLQAVSEPGTWLLILAGNVADQSESRIPRVSEAELRSELGQHFELVQLRTHRFEEADGSDGPLGWSILLRA